MVKLKEYLRECTGFYWGNADSVKNWHKHNVMHSECEQIFFNMPLILRRDKKRSEKEARYYSLGQTDARRLLFTVFTIRDEKIRIISTRDMTNQEERRYKK